MAARYTYLFQGIATRPDKTRGIQIGDTDSQVILDASLEKAVERCTLDHKVMKASYPCSKQWDVPA